MVINHRTVLKALGVAGVVVGARPAFAADSQLPPAPAAIRIIATETSEAPASTPLVIEARPKS